MAGDGHTESTINKSDISPPLPPGVNSTKKEKTEQPSHTTKAPSPSRTDIEDANFCPRNPVGVQLLSRSLQSQLFPPHTTQTPAIHEEALTLSQHHLKSHGLEPEQASTLPPIAFDLPSLQGKDLNQHFWNLGRQVAQPWLGMAHNLAASTILDTLPEGLTSQQESDTDPGEHPESGDFAPQDWLALDPAIRSECSLRPPKWLKKPGWVRYPILKSNDGKSALGSGVPVDYPLEEDGALVFDVETMVEEGQFPVMATAAGPKAWYAWLSPWFLQEGDRHESKDHLIPFGPANGQKSPTARLLIGHNVGYDRARIRDEYSLERSNIRFLDTMSLHVATRGISSPQRGAWVRHNRSKTLERILEQDDVAEVKKAVIRAVLGGEDVDEEILAEFDLEDMLSESAQGRQDATLIPPGLDSNGGSASASLLWQDITSNNGLADVARLHCNIDLPKDTRQYFVDGTSREELVGMMDELLTYCATDVAVTHKVFTKVWPAFVKNCPNPATAAGVLGLSSAILPVDDEWNDYISRCDENYDTSLQQLRQNLVDLAEQLRLQGTKDVSWDSAMAASMAYAMPSNDPEAEEPQDYMTKLQEQETEINREKLWWETDPWASQLDWTPKKQKKDKSAKVGLNGETESLSNSIPKWYRDKVLKPDTGLGRSMSLTPAILRLQHRSRPFVKDDVEKGWTTSAGEGDEEPFKVKGTPLKQTVLKKDSEQDISSGLGPAGQEALESLRNGESDDVIRAKLRSAADALVEWASEHPEEVKSDAQLSLLDWTPVEEPTLSESQSETDDPASQEWWPKWYWDLYKSATGELEITIRSKIAPILLCLTWQGCPLHHSREHGWVFRYDPQMVTPLLTRQKPLTFKLAADYTFTNDIERTVSQKLSKIANEAIGKSSANVDPASITPVYYKVPHAAGDDSNVGSPFSKNFVPFFEKGTLQSDHPQEKGRSAAKGALETNARCSYWIGVRDRVRKQMVVWDGEGDSQMHFSEGASGARQDSPSESKRRKGIILPQIVPMGTVTRRAIEKTWLTASNAKKNRVGSELKAMVKAPPGWSIVGADVDSQELWICSVMGDAQFGFHGATAVGWMTLEGSKSLGTDLHSKTASILGTGRNQAKVFNYSRIYGAGIRHSSQLLLKATPDMSTEEAMQKAKELYASTKGKSTYTDEYFGRKFWFGGTESYVFNKLEEIALGEKPKTPALDCGVTAALTRKYLPKQSSQRQRFGGKGLTGNEDYMPSRINWVVQSSGVDYLHLLITAMEYLISTYDLQARFMISVHDEVRYLAKDEDRARVTLALQIANLWTRAMFAHRLQMDSLPQGVGFFAQVDIDKVLRKETDDPCITPSHTEAIPFGKAVDIYQTLSDTKGGSLYTDAASLIPANEEIDISKPKYKESTQAHRSLGERGLRFLQAQASGDIGEISALEQRASRYEEMEAEGEIDDSDISYMHEIAQTSSQRSRKNGSDALGTKSRRPSTPRRNKQNDQFASMHTSARLDSNLPSDLQDIVSCFPSRPFKLHVPFWKTSEHRFKTLWNVYAALLRAIPKENMNVLQDVRDTIRAYRHCTSPGEVQKLEDRASDLLHLLKKAKKGDKEAIDSLAALEEEISQSEYEKKWTEKAEEYFESIKDKPIPRPSGALLPPTIYNPPLLRYKPVQPDHITMLIAKRRSARELRGLKRADSVERLKHLKVDPFLSETDRMEFSRKISDFELQPMQEAYDRDRARSEMVFSTSMLRVAKHARQGKKRSRERKRNMERETLEE
ncbi:uncharacterized protein FA14DRAFT_142034 [Meira miltonrushii]|uniref:Mitochondrial DNA polymerase catalytic subunit n=1 Tax=Meira miltonrushii TaxID=1280837 RepID=A0A316VIZ7_9BASI|nr:uncharacterized protein FA14DRAFT_142034 [Meira miltonrushii]PWN37609.1 hypothetical protein FA14DRAFT_142034 [Meira miltonrushii]